MPSHDLTIRDTNMAIDLGRLQFQLPDELKSQINQALAVRYMCLTGLIILLYDHFMTFGSERRLVWTAPPSFAKYGFLVNRYLVPTCIFIIFIPLSGFLGLNFSDAACRGSMATISLIMTCSLALGNGLVALRVVALWDYKPRVARMIFGAYFLAYGTAIGCYCAALASRISNIIWSPLLGMCILTRTHALTIPAWAAPITFELFVLTALLWNTVDRPRQIDQTLAAALKRDGIMFYAVMTILRGIQLGLVSTLKPALLVLGGFFIWALVTTTSSRSLMAWRRVELQESSFLPGGMPQFDRSFRLSGTTTLGKRQGSVGSMNKSGMDEPEPAVGMNMSLGVGGKEYGAVKPIELSRVVEVRQWEESMGVRREVRSYDRA